MAAVAREDSVVVAEEEDGEDNRSSPQSRKERKVPVR